MSIEVRPEFDREQVFLFIDGRRVAAMGIFRAKEVGHWLIKAADAVESFRDHGECVPEKEKET